MAKKINFRARLALFFGLMMSVFVFSSQNARANDFCGQLTVGWIDWPPYQMPNPAFPADAVPRGDPIGIDIRAAEKYLGALGCELNYVKKPWARLLKEMEEGKLDVLLGMSDTEERRQYAKFSTAYRNEIVWLFMKAGRTEFDHFQGLSDLIGTNFRLGVSRNAYLGEEFELLSENPKFRERLYKNIGGENFHMLVGERVDGFMVDMETGKARIKADGLEGLVVAHKNVKIDLGSIHIMVGENSLSNELLTRLDEIIEQDLSDIQKNAMFNFTADPSS